MAQLQTRHIWLKLIFDGTTQPNETNQFANGTTEKIIKTSSAVNDININALINIPAGTAAPPTANIVINGLLKQDITSFSRLNVFYGFQMPIANRIEIYAGYDTGEEQPPLVYTGGVQMAVPDYNDANRPFRIFSGQTIATQNVMQSPTNVQGSVQINDLFSQLANNLGVAYEPNAVSGQVSNPILIGSTIQQINKLAADYGYQARIDNNTLIVSKIGSPFRDNLVQINKDNGMLGYPTGNEFGINVRLRFNPAIKFGQRVNVTSDWELANGEWWVNNMTHLLQSQGAKFETVLTLVKNQVGAAQ